MSIFSRSTLTNAFPNNPRAVAEFEALDDLLSTTNDSGQTVAEQLGALAADIGTGGKYQAAATILDAISNLPNRVGAIEITNGGQAAIRPIDGKDPTSLLSRGNAYSVLVGIAGKGTTAQRPPLPTGAVAIYYDTSLAVAGKPVFLRPDGTWTDSNGGTPTGSAVPDGNYGDITVASGVWTINGGVVGFSKMVAATAAGIVGATAAGNFAQLTPAQAKTVLAIAAADVSGLGYFATGTDAANLTGTVAAARLPAFTGDVTTTLGTVATTIAAGAVTLAKMANMATASLIYRKTAGAGAPEVNTLATLKTDLGLTGTNSGDQTITLSGDVSGSGTGAITVAIGANRVTRAMLAQTAGAAILGATAAGNVADLTAAQSKTFLAIVAADVSGLAAIATSGSATDLSAGTVAAARMPALTGDVTTSAGAVATTLAANAVTYAKFQQVAASSLVGNPTGSLANAQGITLAGGLGFSGTTLTINGNITGATGLTSSGPVVVSGSNIAACTITNTSASPVDTPLLQLSRTSNETSPTVAGSCFTIIDHAVNYSLVIKNGTGTVRFQVGPSGNTTIAGTVTVGSATVFNNTGVLQAAAFPALTGDVTTVAGALATTIAANAVTFAKFVAATAAGVVGAGAAGNFSQLGLAGGLGVSGGNLTINGAISAATSVAIAGAITSSGAGVGYATGAGGAVTQLTSKSTGVTLSKLSGQITMNGAALAAAAVVEFTVTNTLVAATDTINLNLASGATTTSAYRYWISAVAAGSFKVAVENRSAGSLSEALVFNFALIKAVAA